MLFREAGWKLLLPLILLCIIINTVCLRILERCVRPTCCTPPFPPPSPLPGALCTRRRSETSMVNNYYDASWVTVVTMSTVGCALRCPRLRPPPAQRTPDAPAGAQTAT